MKTIKEFKTHWNFGILNKCIVLLFKHLKNTIFQYNKDFFNKNTNLKPENILNL